MRKVVICALDLNVLRSYSLHDQGWETRLGTLKVSGLYRKKVEFPLKISDRAWWLEALVLKHPGKLSRWKGNGPQDMEIDHAGTVQSSLSSKTCQTKAVVTEVDLEHKEPVETLEGKREISCHSQAHPHLHSLILLLVFFVTFNISKLVSSSSFCLSSTFFPSFAPSTRLGRPLAFGLAGFLSGCFSQQSFASVPPWLKSV